MKASIPAALAGERVDRAVALLGGLTRAEVAELVRAGRVRLSGAPVSTRSRRVAGGEDLEVDLPSRGPPSGVGADPSVDVRVVHADGDIVVVDKPSGLVVHPGAGHPSGTLVQGLVARFPDLADAGAGDAGRPGIVQRLDKGTSGLLVVARTADAYRSLVEQLSGRPRAIERRYLALVLGSVDADAGEVEAPMGRSERDPTRMAISRRGRPARTAYRVETRYRLPAEATLVDCRLDTGRTHQIRVHLAAIGHPVAGDVRYGGAEPRLELERPFLHAHRLSFDHPRTGERLGFTSPLPADLTAVLATLS
ncbi:MAG TPA: RluA family pseudouridine synthase [Acidimicrobiales bacterium]|nr:RluA family pseudouridine synthase [Acidimicrobiales bacterium]